ncbi:hypothetical protein QAD02_022885 [Eretmocerus hayati]|uniref:Uncharacterized protein n=1 Tax=Eretmocerus hayati TaxID=131215 RepID=A0ACC2PVX4_9HYME|nr:hypothetical protein QAD02_022885 [Eretmocerus hayati]
MHKKSSTLDWAKSEEHLLGSFSGFLPILHKLTSIFFGLTEYVHSRNRIYTPNGKIFRHGARTPSAEEARYINVSDPRIYGHSGFYQLTQEGKRQVYELGSSLRQRYSKFLGEYKPNEIFALSTRSSRTKMSLQLVLAGLFPPDSKNQWNPQLNWIPIPAPYVNTRFDVLLAPHQCPKYIKLHEIETREFFRKSLIVYEDFLQFMENKTRISFRSNYIYNFGWSYYAIKIHKMMNLPLPEWCTDDVMKTLEKLLELGLESMSLTTKLKKLNGGTLIREVLRNIDGSSNASLKIFLYSTHDLTLAAFTKAQKIEMSLPEFGSAIIVEEHEDSNGDIYIKMITRDPMKKYFETMKIPGCEEYCNVEKYKKIVKEVIPTDEDIKYLLGA